MPRTRATAARDSEEVPDEASMHRATSAPLQGSRRRGRARAPTSRDQGDAPGDPMSAPVTIQDYLTGMVSLQQGLGSVQRVVEQLAAIQAAATSSQGRSGGAGPSTGDDVPMAEYTRLRPMEFDGMSGDPLKFLDEVKKRTKDLRCSEKRAIELAGFSLTGIASQWFQTYMSSYIDGLTWKKFEENFIPFSVREKKRCEFESLTRGDRTVEEYTRQFIQLSRYAPHSVATESLKVCRFIRGLGPEFLALAPYRKGTFLEVADLARQMEVDLRHHGIIQGESKKKKNRIEEQTSGQTSGTSHGHREYSEGTQLPMRTRGGRGHRRGRRNSRHNRGSGQSYPSSGSGQGSNPSSSSSGSGPCQQCGRPHHGPCLYGTGACYRCGMMGHMARNCPNFPRQQVYVQDPSVSVVQPIYPAAQGSLQIGTQYAGQQGRGHGGRAPGGRASGRHQGHASGSQPTGRGHARVFTLTPHDAMATNTVLSGIIPICYSEE